MYSENFKNHKNYIEDPEKEAYKDGIRRIKSYLKIISQRVNQENNSVIKEGELRPTPLLDEKAAITLSSFSREEVNGPYYNSWIEEDQKFVKKREFDYSGVTKYEHDLNEATIVSNEEREEARKAKEFYAKEYNAHTPEEIVEIWKKKQEKGKSFVCELTITALFDKYFGDKFLVVRASNFDDYKNGVDNVIVDKETGQVICAFDEVSDRKDGEGAKKKEEKIIKIAKAGGTHIKYGLTYKDNQLLKKAIKNIPIFFLAIENKELENLVKSIDLSSSDSKENELETISRLLKSLEVQRSLLLDQEIPEEIRKNLESFNKPLNTLNQILLQKSSIIESEVTA
ncbi:MAG: hypothetical protein MUF50_02110 [Planctomycetes bacterium]|nr:hypothetical protein [Planctomycetota bacterium]